MQIDLRYLVHFEGDVTSINPKFLDWIMIEIR